MATHHDPTLDLPRLLCLHGGGTNAVIFTMQCRVLSLHLRPYFRLVYVEAPFAAGAGPDVTNVYGDFGPFKRWLGWLPEHEVLDPRDEVIAIEESIEKAMREDDAKGATGGWVGLLGFSQGAKIAGSLLLRRQIREEGGRDLEGQDWRFAVLMAGRAPLISLERDQDRWGPVDENDVLTLPTIHVHGMRDPGLDLHRELLKIWCEKGSTQLVEWNGNHRIPIKSGDVEAVVNPMLALAKKLGVLTVDLPA
ncbi:hypothetical protein SS1G_04710 [Sclerotinia sclerotiorum 1980 UF-70]|uniref:Serine hydrolase domain-containing protein n=2 Tax=Sclerotinia sclerotiorum (strain ATCC 18683 / 1980 / Ss-1) TaxID=665079 RepID=A7EHB8_SCLS1|nr:hypothetical protein SS1G_04710 [Sclerotinia sclerotiorum 1980 UF-70]APA06702.1 hypothetical protein sscle_02g014720 [Sclerotinia sclerotiorum 1980 UF-70]EDO02234.1 hypothetical protein SS1G_04710 [Sclerotinia sclerotiorum 1980 UF-70]